MLAAMPPVPLAPMTPARGSCRHQEAAVGTAKQHLPFPHLLKTSGDARHARCHATSAVAPTNASLAAAAADGRPQMARVTDAPSPPPPS